MNSIAPLKSARFGACAGLLLATAAATYANTLITFQVDMSNVAFDPSSETVTASGTFNNWGQFPLTNNPSAANSNLWTGTTNFPGNGSVMGYKYVIQPAGTYESVAEGGNHNRLALLPSTSGASLVLPQVYFNDSPPAPVNVDVTFQVNMAQQINTGAFIPGTSSVAAPGFYNSWSTATAMTNDPTILTTNSFGLVSSNVYVYTVTITGSPGQTTDYKYYIDTGANWEAPPVGDPYDNNNRFFNLGSGATQKLPISYFNDAPYAPVATNAVTFQVDMTAQVLNGNFNPSVGTVEVRGDFNSWGTPQLLCTNNPSAANTNIYSTVVSITDGIGATRNYKFFGTVSVNGGWETMANNRQFQIKSGTSQVLPVVFFSNVDPSDLLPADTMVTFTVNMTNAVGTDSHPFDPVNDQVYINGAPNGFAPWSTALTQLTNNPVGSELYSVDMLVPQGSPVVQTYRYGINGVDDEGPTGVNHVRVIRTSGSGSYAMPLDNFGPSPVVEPSFGNLTAAKGPAGQATISWLGRPGVHLQSTTSLSAPATWQDHPETDGGVWTQGIPTVNGLLSVTNVSTANGKTFYRLIKQ